MARCGVGAVGPMFLKCSRRFFTKKDVSVDVGDGAKKLPGRRNVSPYTNYAEVVFKSSFQAARIPIRMVGKTSVHRIFS